MTTQQTRNIAVIGDGNVGGALSKGLENAGHEVHIADNDPKAVEQVSDRADVVILAVPFGAVPDVVETAGHLWTGKTVIDVTNAVDAEFAYAASLEESGAEKLQALVPDAKVVKAFNTVFAEHQATGQLDGERLTAFAASDHEDAREAVLALAEDIGFDPVDAGPLETAAWLEALGYLNIQLGYMREMGTDIGFKLHHR